MVAACLREPLLSRRVDHAEPLARVIDLPLLELAHVQVERRGDLRMTGEARDLSRVRTRADQVRDRGVTQVMERDALLAVWVEPPRGAAGP